MKIRNVQSQLHITRNWQKAPPSELAGFCGDQAIGKFSTGLVSTKTSWLARGCFLPFPCYMWLTLDVSYFHLLGSNSVLEPIEISPFKLKGDLWIPFRNPRLDEVSSYLHFRFLNYWKPAVLSKFSSELSGHSVLPKVLVANAEIHRSKKGKAKEAKLVCSTGGIRTGRS